MEEKETVEVVETEVPENQEEVETTETIEEEVVETVEEESEYDKQMREIKEIRETLEAQLFEQQLKERGLEIFAEVNKVHDLEGTEKLDYLQGLVDAILAKHSYKPLNPVGDSANDVIEAELKQGKVENSLGQKFKGWFGGNQ